MTADGGGRRSTTCGGCWSQRGPEGRQRGFLVLNSQMILGGRRLALEPLLDQCAPSGTTVQGQGFGVGAGRGLGLLLFGIAIGVMMSSAR